MCEVNKENIIGFIGIRMKLNKIQYKCTVLPDKSVTVNCYESRQKQPLVNE